MLEAVRYGIPNPDGPTKRSHVVPAGGAVGGVVPAVYSTKAMKSWSEYVVVAPVPELSSA